MTEHSKQTTDGQARLEELRRLRDSIQQGSYQVDAGTVADAMIRASRVLRKASPTADGTSAAEKGTSASKDFGRAEKPSSFTEDIHEL